MHQQRLLYEPVKTDVSFSAMRRKKMKSKGVKISEVIAAIEDPVCLLRYVEMGCLLLSKKSMVTQLSLFMKSNAKRAKLLRISTLLNLTN